MYIHWTLSGWLFVPLVRCSTAVRYIPSFGYCIVPSEKSIYCKWIRNGTERNEKWTTPNRRNKFERKKQNLKRKLRKNEDSTRIHLRVHSQMVSALWVAINGCENSIILMLSVRNTRCELVWNGCAARWSWWSGRMDGCLMENLPTCCWYHSWIMQS